ncbi:MAG: aminopeptidase P family protein [Armatimonadetes bacterium]|nr:aminopeptidase P family protein [Armatimonadota bacterium]
MGSEPSIPKEEFKQRQVTAAREAGARGLDGLLVWSRGGSTVDRHANVLYLANHYSQFPFIPDFPPHWTGRAHSCVVMPSSGEPTLLVDLQYYREDLVAVDDVRMAFDLVGLVAEVVKEKGLARGRLGIVGADVLPYSFFTQLRTALPDAQFEEADDILGRMRMIKSPAELEIIRRSCEIGSRAISTIMENAAPGKTEAEIASTGVAELVASGVAIYSVPVSSGPNSWAYGYARLPTYDHTRKLEKGDIFHLDLIGAYQGYYFDLSRSTVVGSAPTEEQRRTLDLPVECVTRVIDAIKPGVTAEQVAAVGQSYLEEVGELKTVAAGDARKGFTAFGHSLGLMWEGPWFMKGDSTVIQPGMYLAVEYRTSRRDFGGAQFEENFVVTDTGVEILTNARERWW